MAEWCASAALREVLMTAREAAGVIAVGADSWGGAASGVAWRLRGGAAFDSAGGASAVALRRRGDDGQGCGVAYGMHGVRCHPWL